MSRVRRNFVIQCNSKIPHQVHPQSHFIATITPPSHHHLPPNQLFIFQLNLAIELTQTCLPLPQKRKGANVSWADHEACKWKLHLLSTYLEEPVGDSRTESRVREATQWNADVTGNNLIGHIVAVLEDAGELHPTHKGTLEFRYFSCILLRSMTVPLVSVDPEMHCICVAGVNFNCNSSLTSF